MKPPNRQKSITVLCSGMPPDSVKEQLELKLRRELKKRGIVPDETSWRGVLGFHRNRERNYTMSVRGWRR